MVFRRRGGGVHQDVRALFDSGTTVGLTDAELLGRFTDRTNGYGEGAAGPAFAALMERHGRMVLRVCRSILRDEHDAQDAFQATFLVLVRRAQVVRRRESIGSWLHGVALRVSTRARADLARRRRHERIAGAARAAVDRPDSGGIAPEHAAVLHEELGRLPERYRAAVVLCYLEGDTCETAANRLGWPVGTVKSRLSRGRERLRCRLIRRGLTPNEVSGEPPVPASFLLSGVARATADAMLRFADGRATVGPISARALAWTQQTLRTIQMARLTMVSAPLIIGLTATVAAIWTVQGREPAQSRPAQSSEAAGRSEPAKPKPTTPEKTVEIVTVRVADRSGRAAPNVEVEVLEHSLDHEGPRYRTDSDGRVRIPVDPYADPAFGARFLARPDARTMGWAYLPHPKQRMGRGIDPIPLVLLPRTHAAEGSVVDRSGKPIPGVGIRAIFIEQETNRAIIDLVPSPQGSLLGSAVTDEAGRYTLKLPDRARASLIALHPRYVGPAIQCGPDQRTIPPLAMEDGGSIAGTVVDAAAGRPVEGARLHANRIEFDGRQLLGAGWATSDAHGRFRIDGLAPGVYNLSLYGSPRGKTFIAPAIEGVRVQAGKDATADLKLIEGRRIHGSVVDVETGKPMSRVPVLCSSSAWPGSGHAGEAAYTDDQGWFEFFVPPGLASVYLDTSTQAMGSPRPDRGADTRTLVVAADRDPDPVRLLGGHDPTGSSLKRGSMVARPTQVRVRAEALSGDARDGGRTLMGRIFDQDGTPIAGVQINYNDQGRSMTYATDRLGVFRIGRLPPRELHVSVNKKGYQSATATISPKAAEVEITLSRKPAGSY